MNCPACRAPTISSRRYSVAEYMLGTGRVFHYEPCSACGSSTIVDPPLDLAEFYPSSYAAFAKRHGGWLDVRRRLGFDDRVRALVRLRAPVAARLLDVGCGSGDFLRAMAARGFRDLTGIDPYLPFEAGVRREARYIKGDLAALYGERFDVVTMHHVLEHVPDVSGFLRDAASCLAPDGVLLVRTPLLDSWAARTYGARWAQHDAPRHLVLLTSDGLARAAAAAGLRVGESWRDEGRWQAWASATLAAGTNPFDPTSLATKLGRFRYSAVARRRNREGTGDQGCFILRAERDAGFTA